MYKVVTIKTDGTVTETTQPKAPELKQLQAAVGGYIETVPHFTKLGTLKRGTAYCNEDGIAKGLAYNQKATEAWRACLGKGPFRYEPNLIGDVIFYAKQPKGVTP